MPIPRYRGYGFRNIDGWEIRANCARTGRNLNIASSGVLLYIISGASIDGISIGGASLSIAYPSAFVWFGVVAFVWLGYRFLVAFRDATDVDPWWHLYMRDILLIRHPISRYVQQELKRRFAPAERKSYAMSSTHVVVKSFGVLSGTLVVPEVRLNDAVVGKDIEIVIPRWEIARAHFHCFPRYLLSNNDIADMWVPWFLYGIAIAAILSDVCGHSPAGLYGLFSVRP